MSGIDQIDPELRGFLDAMRRDWAKHPPLTSLPFPEQRAVAEQVRARWTEGGPIMARTIEDRFRSRRGELRVRVHVPHGVTEPAPALVYLHGGGFTLFSIDTHDRLMREYAEAGRFVVIGLDYPLAPEARFPVALNLIVEFILWLKDNAAAWGIDPARLAMGGDSAGGNLSFATCLRLRDLGSQSLVRAILSNYGGFIASISDEAEARFGGPGSIMDRAEALQYYANYLRSPDDAHNPYACPLNADLSGFPPVFLVIPEQDIVAEQSVAMAERLRAFRVPTEAKLYPGAMHSFLEAMSVSALAREAIADGAAFVSRQLA
ncbi:MAG TPA: alpha/beta hydrolase fold domain-containing protein [Sphingomonas sp.]|nr:alpha/beta hydrolase fold domain-containing protein [Sphingomonas sp.]